MDVIALFAYAVAAASVASFFAWVVRRYAAEQREGKARTEGDEPGRDGR